jgi:hypothetical protein
MSEQTTPKPTTSFFPPRKTPSLLTKWGPITDFLTAALYWDYYGFDVIPIVPSTKQPAVKWNSWLDNLGPEKMKEYWNKNPEHELAFVVGDDMIVFDADSPEAVAVISQIEARFEIAPRLLIKTNRGEHHYFRRAVGTIAKSDAHNSEKYPDRLDIKTGRALVILPPSTGKSVITKTAENKSELTEVTQEFIDAVYKHNGRQVPSKVEPPLPPAFDAIEATDTQLPKIEALLNCIDSDCGYEDWLKVGMATYHETKGSDEGLALFDRWSRKGNKYKGIKEIEAKWRSFRPGVATPVTIGTLVMMAKNAGVDVSTILNSGDDEFEICDFEVIDNDGEKTTKVADFNNPLAKYYLRDVAELEKNAVEQIAILGKIVLLGQSTVIYAKQNTGKTLITLSLIVDGIKAGNFDPSKLIYINMDDDSKGLAVKARLAEEYGFQMVADGHHGFEAKAFRTAMEKMIETGSAQGCIVILDTLKKFVNTMDKGKCSDFAKVVRQFVLKGGTVIALSHANKNPGNDGKPVYSGTTDIIDDFDCGYTLRTISQDPDKQVNIVEFENIKRRGNVALTAAYSYALECDVEYNELLLSVQEFDEKQLIPLKQSAEVTSDGEVIRAIESCIKERINTKMKLADEAAKRAKVSKRHALKIIEKYGADESALQKWHYEVREHGAKVYVLLERPTGHAPALAMPTP